MKNKLTFSIILGLFIGGIFSEANAQSSNMPQSLSAFNESGLSITDFTPSSNNDQSQNLPNGDKSVTANLTYYTDRNNFDAAAPGLPIETFENSSIAPGALGNFFEPLNETTNNAYFSPGDVLSGIEINSNSVDLVVLGSGFFGYPSNIVIPNQFADNAIYNFSPAVDAVGLDIVDLTGGTDCNIEIYDAGLNLIASTTSTMSLPGVFWGVTSDTPIGRITITSTTNTGEGADNIAFGSTAPPVPVSNWSIIIAFLLLATTFVFVRKLR